VRRADAVATLPTVPQPALLSSNPLAVEEGARPSLVMLIGIFIAHATLWIGLVRTVPGKDRVSFAELGAPGTPWFRQFVIPLAVVLLFQLALIRSSRWKRSVWRDPWVTTRRWLVVLPGLMLALAVAGLQIGAMREVDDAYLIGMTLTVALVGVTEELTFRGIMIAGGRRVFAREWQAVVFASATFGLFHLPNALLGAALGATLLQVVQTALIGSTFYALRRVTGLLVPCMILHGVYDWLVLIRQP